MEITWKAEIYTVLEETYGTRMATGAISLTYHYNKDTIKCAKNKIKSHFSFEREYFQQSPKYEKRWMAKFIVDFLSSVWCQTDNAPEKNWDGWHSLPLNMRQERLMPLQMEAKHTDMRINHENHRESPHRINTLYPSFCHNCYKNTINSKLFSYHWDFVNIYQHD